MDAPILQQVDQTSNLHRALQALMGKYRPSTVRRYLEGWLMTGLPEPHGGITFIDYLYAREEQGLGPSASVQAVGWFESLAGFPEEDRVTSRSMVGYVLIRKLQSGPPSQDSPEMDIPLRWPDGAAGSGHQDGGGEEVGGLV